MDERLDINWVAGTGRRKMSEKGKLGGYMGERMGAKINQLKCMSMEGKVSGWMGE